MRASEYKSAVLHGLVQPLGGEAPVPERRPQAPSARRKPVLLPGVICHSDGSGKIDCTIRNISEGGARIALPRHAELPARFYLIDVRERIVYDARVTWDGEGEMGLSFAKSFSLTGKVDPALNFLRAAWMERAVR